MTARTVHMAYGHDGLEIAVPSNATIIEPTYVPGLPDEQAALVNAIRNPIDGDSSDLDVGGDLGTARLPSLTEFDVNVGGSAGEILVRGGVSDLDVDVDGDLTELVVTRGASDLEVDVDGNATSIQVSGGGEDLDVWVGGILDEFLLRGSLVDSDVEAESGITSFTVTDVLADSDVDTTHYDGVGDPIGAGIGTFRVNEMRNVDVETHTDITEFVVRGAVTDSDVDTRAYDNYGGGSLVGGGGIAEFRALGLYDGDVHTFGAITEMRIGRGGVDMDTEIDTADAATGHLVLLQTPGFIFGDIQIAGDVTDVLTGGADALPGSAPVDFLFVDNHSVPTLGTLEVDGAILGTVS